MVPGSTDFVNQRKLKNCHRIVLLIVSRNNEIFVFTKPILRFVRVILTPDHLKSVNQTNRMESIPIESEQPSLFNIQESPALISGEFS